MRQNRWSDRQFVNKHNMWQAAIDDKIVGAVYARSLGVQTPSVMWCNTKGVHALPSKFPESWGCCFVIKPLHGYNDLGVVIVEDGFDRFSGWRMQGKQDVLDFFKFKSFPLKVISRTIYVETVIRPESNFARNVTPPDYKVLVFGEEIATVGVIMGRKTKEACMAWYDQDYARVDLNGCVCFNSTQVPLKQGACIYRHCPTDFPPKPRRWDEMLATARKLGAGLGVHMRLDFFPGEHGVVLGEFTPWHTNGKVHCDSRNILVPGEVHPRVDYCTLGKRWKRYRPSDDNERLGSFEGGWLPPHTQTTPAAIEGWQSFAFDDSQKCELARKHLRPASWVCARVCICICTCTCVCT